MEEEIQPGSLTVHENTYCLEPEDGKRFNQGDVRSVIQSNLENTLNGVTYDPAKTSELSKKLSQDIQASVKRLDTPNYKYVVQVTIGQMKGQGARIASRCLWDKKNDNFVSVSYKNVSIWSFNLVVLAILTL